MSDRGTARPGYCVLWEFFSRNYALRVNGPPSEFASRVLDELQKQGLEVVPREREVVE